MRLVIWRILLVVFLLISGRSLATEITIGMGVHNIASVKVDTMPDTTDDWLTNEMLYDLHAREEQLISANGVWYFHKYAVKGEKIRRFRENECGFKDSLTWKYQHREIMLGANNARNTHVNPIGKSSEYSCTIDPVIYAYRKQHNSCKTEWYADFFMNILISVNNDGEKLYHYRLRKRKLVLREVIDLFGREHSGADLLSCTPTSQPKWSRSLSYVPTLFARGNTR